MNHLSITKFPLDYYDSESERDLRDYIKANNMRADPNTGVITEQALSDLHATQWKKKKVCSPFGCREDEGK